MQRNNKPEAENVQRTPVCARSIAEAARTLNLSERTVWRMIGRGAIKSVRVSERRRIITDDEINRILGGEAA
jgi:excisionase family DNA binding protein